MTELKPCPFCGGEARVEDPDHVWGDVAVKEIVCSVCFASGPILAEEKAVEAWNNRAAETSIQKMLDSWPTEEMWEAATKHAMNCGAVTPPSSVIHGFRAVLRAALNEVSNDGDVYEQPH